MSCVDRRNILNLPDDTLMTLHVVDELHSVSAFRPDPDKYTSTRTCSQKLASWQGLIIVADACPVLSMMHYINSHVSHSL